MTYSGCLRAINLNSLRLRKCPHCFGIACFKDGASNIDSSWLRMPLWSGGRICFLQPLDSVQVLAYI